MEPDVHNTSDSALFTPHQMKPCDPFQDEGPWAILHPLSIMSHFIKQTEEFNVSHGSDGRAKLITRKLIEAGTRFYPPPTIAYQDMSFNDLKKISKPLRMPGVAVVQHNSSWVARSTKSFDVGEKVDLLGGEVSVASAADINADINAVHKLTLLDNNGQPKTLYVTAQNETGFVYVGSRVECTHYLSYYYIVSLYCVFV